MSETGLSSSGSIPTAQIELFVAAYLATFDARLAAKAARLAPERGPQYLRLAAIRDRIRGNVSQRLEEFGVNAERVLSEVAAIAFSRPGSVVRVVTNDDGVQTVRVLDSDLWGPELHAAFAGAEQDKDGIIRVKWHDKQRALELLAKHLGLNLAEDLSVKVFLVPAQNRSEAEWEKQAKDVLTTSRDRAMKVLEAKEPPAETA